MFNRTLCATRRLALGCSFRSLVEDCSSAFENGAHFLGIDDPCLIQRLGFQTHQPSRHVVFDGEDQVDVQVVIRSTMLLGICSRSNPVRPKTKGPGIARRGLGYRVVERRQFTSRIASNSRRQTDLPPWRLTSLDVRGGLYSHFFHLKNK